MQNIIKILIVGFFTFLIGIFYLSLNKDFNYDTKKLVGNELNVITLENFIGKNSISTNDLKKNDFTLINFWASWCSPCRTEHPVLMKLNKEKNLKLLGINFKDKQNLAKIFLDELGNPYDFIATDYQGKQSVNFGVYGIPESILINKELIILKKYIGPLTNDDFNEIKEIIN